jgi:hypothetical protein
MSAHILAFCAAAKLAVTRSFRTGFGMLAILLSAALLLLAGCTDAPKSPVAGPDPGDPGARAPRVGYRSTVAPYTSHRPVDPGPWVEQNERVAPQPKSGR